MKNITRLTVSNLLRIRAAEVTPDGALVVVGGRNDQGKSSLLNAIAIALSGKDLPPQPIRSGAASGYVILETEDMVVTRSFSQTGGSKLEVRDREGVRITTPQAKLDALVSKVTFDPFEFTRMAAKAQLETVRKIAGLDFTELDNEFSSKFEQRTEVNRRVKGQEAKMQAIPRSPDAPAEEVSVSRLTTELQAAQEANRLNQEERDRLSDLNDAIDTASEQIVAREEGIGEAQRRLAEAQAALDNARALLSSAKDARAAAVVARDEHKTKVAGLLDEDVEFIIAKLNAADSTNNAVRNNARWRAEQQEYLKLSQEAGTLTDRLEAIKKQKEETLAKAQFPVQGLGFNENGVTFNDIPFEQASTSAQIKISVAIARSLNPKLPVMLIRDGSLLDEGNMKLIAEEAEATGCQVWVEVVGDSEDATVIIEDGEVIATPAAAKKKKAAANQ